MSNKSILFSTRNSKDLSKKISSLYGESLGDINFIEFEDGEYEPSLEQSVRGMRVFLIGSTVPPADNLMELLLMCDAAHRALAKEIILVIPYFGWARQDRKNKSRSPIGAKLVTNLIEASGATRVITMDLHTDQIQGFFKIPIDHLYAYKIFMKYVKSLNLQNITIASPDIGGANRIKNYANDLNADRVICYKERTKSNKIDSIHLIGEVKGRHVILIDDIVDTAETITMAADLIKEQGANSVRAIATHPVLSGDSYERIISSCLEELVVTDSLSIKRISSCKIKVLSSAALFADAISYTQ
ncbi:ribose-phosphate pyrophosphokinase [Candidatus Walczuchella endosymbiont of Icerya purchasi]|uniref:ribose-phosphate diphosphokinase n=1 Tax=Candidatus Walczuchella endosymbiont of Icerya purchasi TaxID=3066219 RepID=UPI00313AB2D3